MKEENVRSPKAIVRKECLALFFKSHKLLINIIRLKKKVRKKSKRSNVFLSIRSLLIPGMSKENSEKGSRLDKRGAKIKDREEPIRSEVKTRKKVDVLLIYTPRYTIVLKPN